MEEEYIGTSVSETSCENPGTPTRHCDDGNITSPFRWCTNQCQAVLLTSPLRHEANLRQNFDLEHNQTNNDISFNTLEFNVATPPPPTPCTLIKAAKIPSIENGSIVSPESRPSVVSRFFGLYGCSASLQKSIEQLGWVAEQLLCAPLEKISHILQSLQYKCNGAEWQQLLRLRDSFLQCAVSHLELNLLLHSHVFSSDAIPFSVNTILTQFFRLAESIDNRLVTKKTLPLLVEDASATVKDKLPSKFQLSGFPIPSASSQCTGTIVPVPESCSNEDSLNKKLISIMRKETVKRMGKILTSPIQNETTLEMDSMSVKYYSSPVIRRAQRRLGDIWNLMEEFGSGDQLVEAICQNTQPQKSTCTLSLFKKKKPLLSQSFSTQSKNGQETEITMGALSLMGARYIRKGRYISKKNVLAQRKRTREKNKKRNLALDNAKAEKNCQNLISNKEDTKECFGELKDDYLSVTEEKKKSTKLFQDSDGGTIFIEGENILNNFASQANTQNILPETGKHDIGLTEKSISELGFFKHLENKNLAASNQNIPIMYNCKENVNSDRLIRESEHIDLLRKKEEEMDSLIKIREENDFFSKRGEDMDVLTENTEDIDLLTKKSENIDFLTKNKEESCLLNKKKEDIDLLTKKRPESGFHNKKKEESDSVTKKRLERDFLNRKRDYSVFNTSETRQVLLTTNNSTGIVNVEEPNLQHNDFEIKEDCSFLLENKNANFFFYKGGRNQYSAVETLNEERSLDTKQNNLSACVESGNDACNLLENGRDEKVLDQSKIDKILLVSNLHENNLADKKHDTQTHWNEASKE